MPFSESDRYNILRHLDLAQKDLPRLRDRLSATEAQSETLVAKCLEILASLDVAQLAYDKAATNEAGLQKADVLEWDSVEKIYQIRRHKGYLKRQLARLIGIHIESEISSAF